MALFGMFFYCLSQVLGLEAWKGDVLQVTSYLFNCKDDSELAELTAVLGGQTAQKFLHSTRPGSPGRA